MQTLTPRPLLRVLTLCLLGAFSAAAQCRDPRIGQLYQQFYNRKPVGRGEGGECNIHLYNNGSRGSRDESMGYIKQVQQSGLRVGVAPLGGNTVMAVARGDQIFAVSLLHAGGNLVASGEGNLTGLSNSTLGFNIGSNYGTLAVGLRRVVASGKVTLGSEISA